MTDAELAERVRRGDLEAFGELVGRHRNAVFRAASAALGDRGEAEDAAQEALVAAYRKIGSFRGEASFKTWLLAIAWRKALARRRQWRPWLRQPFGGRARSADDGELAQAAVASNEPGPERLLLESELEGHIRRLIGALPPRYRDVLLLSGTGDHTIAEMARLLGVPEGTVKWRIMEARRQLRRKLARLGYGHD